MKLCLAEERLRHNVEAIKCRFGKLYSRRLRLGVEVVVGVEGGHRQGMNRHWRISGLWSDVVSVVGAGIEAGRVRVGWSLWRSTELLACEGNRMGEGFQQLDWS